MRVGGTSQATGNVMDKKAGRKIRRFYIVGTLSARIRLLAQQLHGPKMHSFQGPRRLAQQKATINIIKSRLLSLDFERRKAQCCFIIGRGLARAPVAERPFVLQPDTAREQR